MGTQFQHTAFGSKLLQVDMIEILHDDYVYKHLGKYYDVLSKRGYIGKDIVLKFVVWLFLYDFVGKVDRFMKEPDYELIDKMLSHLFDCNYCFFPGYIEK